MLVKTALSKENEIYDLKMNNFSQLAKDFFF